MSSLLTDDICCGVLDVTTFLLLF